MAKLIADKTLECLWQPFRDAVGRLSVREKVRPAHWQRTLGWYLGLIQTGVFRGAEDPALIERVITEMMEASRSWCNPDIGVDDAQAREALRKACNTILIAQDSTGTGAQPVDDVPLSEPVDVKARTAALVAEMGL